MKYLFLSLILFSIISCREEVDDPVPSNYLRLSLNTHYNGQPFNLNSTFSTQEGYQIQFTKLNFILSNVMNGTNELTPAAVFKYSNNPTLIYEGEGDYTKFNALTGNIGVGPDENHQDPSALELNNPLQIQNSGDMHWGWNPGYVFVMIEGKADTSANLNGNMDYSFAYHIGMDHFLKSFEFNSINWQKVNDSVHNLELDLDLAKLFNGISQVDIKTEPMTHSMPNEQSISTKIIDNFMSGLTTN